MDLLQNTRLSGIVLFCLALILYANTISHDFVLDDTVVIVKNTFVKKGFGGIADIFSNDSFAGFEEVGEGKSVLEGGRYRPLSLAFFAILYSVFGANSFVFHAFAILLYAISALTLYRLLLLLLQNAPARNAIAFLTTLIFVAHPVHTEVVANVKSCDEQFAFLFGLSALFAAIRSIDTRELKWYIASGILFALAFFSKEHVVVLVIIAPLAMWYFRSARLQEMVKATLPLLISLGLYLILRLSVIDADSGKDMMVDPLNNPFVIWDSKTWITIPGSDKYATILYTLGHYVRLLVLPFPLTHDYYPFTIEWQSFGNPFVILSAVVFLGMIAFGIFSLRKKVVAGFGILFFLIALSIVSNVFFAMGTFMAERFLYLPSVGFCLALVAGGYQLLKTNRNNLALPVFGMIALVFAVLTFVRNGAWKDNETLLTIDLKHSENSAKLRNDLGTILLVKALQEQDTSARRVLMREAYVHLDTAVQKHPTYYDAYLALGAAAFYLGDYMKSTEAYLHATELFPEDEKANMGLLFAMRAFGIAEGTSGDAKKAVVLLTEAWRMQPDTTTALRLSALYSKLNQEAGSLDWFAKAAQLVPEDAGFKYRLARAYAASGKSAQADSVYREAIKINPALPKLR